MIRGSYQDAAASHSALGLRQLRKVDGNHTDARSFKPCPRSWKYVRIDNRIANAERVRGKRLGINVDQLDVAEHCRIDPATIDEQQSVRNGSRGVIADADNR